MKSDIEKNKILCVGNFDSNTGYAWKLIEKLWTYISEMGSEKDLETIAAYPSVSSINPSLVESDISVIERNFPTTGLRYCFSNCRFIKENKISILYLTDRAVLSWHYIFYRAVGVKKIIIHDHTPGFRSPLIGLKAKIKKVINYLPWITCDLAIGVSPYVCERLELVNQYPKNKITCVTNGMPATQHIKTFNPLVAGSKIRIVTVARANYYKGIDFAIRTIANLVHGENMNNIEYVFIGDGPDLLEFKKLAKTLNVENHVVFMGKRSDVEELLPTFDIALHPSKGEAMCLAIVEYMRAGLPVITSDNLSVNSILKNEQDSLFYTEFSEQSAVKTLKRLVADHALRTKLGLFGNSRYNDFYSEDTMKSNFRETLKSHIL